MLTRRRLVSLALSCLCALSTAAAYASGPVAPVTLTLPATGSVAFPSTATGGGSNTVAVSVQINVAGTVSIAIPASANAHTEFTVGTVSGCTADGVATVTAGTTCSFSVTFAPYYPGQRFQPLAVTLGGQVYSFGVTGYATGPLARLDPTYLSTLAGKSGVTSGGAVNNVSDISATTAAVYEPEGIAVDSSNNVYTAVNGDDLIRVIYQQANPQLICLIQTENPAIFHPTVANTCIGATKQPTTGDIYTIAGTGTSASTGDNALASAAGIEPVGVAVDAAGNVFIGAQDEYKVRVVYQGGTNIACLIQIENPTTFGVTGNDCTTATSYPTPGFIYTIAGTGTANETGDGALASAATLERPAQVKVDAAGDVFMSNFTASATESFAGKIRVIYNGGAAAAQLITLENSTVTTPTIGFIYTVAGNAKVEGGDGNLATATAVGMVTIYAMDIDQYDNLYIADKTYSTGIPLNTERVRVVYNAGAATTGNPLATLIGLENSGATAQAGYIYTVAGPTTGVGQGYKPTATATVTGFSIASGVATITVSAAMNGQNSGATAGLQVGGQITVAGLTSTVGATLNGTFQTIVGAPSPTTFQLATTSADTTTTTDSGTVTYSIYPADGVLATDPHSMLAATYGMCVNAAGDILVTDRYQYTIRRISAATGLITTIAGQPAPTNQIVSGLALGGAGRLWGPWSVISSSGGGVYFADYGANRIRVLESTESSTYPLTVPTVGAGTNSGTVNFLETNVGTPGSTLALTNESAIAPFGILSPVPSYPFTNIGECLTSGSLSTSNALSVNLTAGHSCQIGVAANTTSAGTYTGTATMTDNSVNTSGSTHTVYLTTTSTGVAVAFSTNPLAPYAGASTVLTAVLTNGATPVTSGSVTFSFTGGATIGSGTLDPVTGTASVTTSALTTGTDNITVSYPGATGVNPLFVAATLNTSVVVAAKPVPIVTVSATPTAINAGSTSTITVTVTPTSGTPTGTVTVTDKIGTASATTICSGALSGTSPYTYSCSPALATGTHTINATYSGDGNFATAVTTTAATVTATALPTTTALVVAPASGNLNQQVTMTATVSGFQTGVNYTGSVSFKDTFTPQGSTTSTPVTYGPIAVNATTGVAVYQSTALPAGSHVISAVFASDANYATSTSATTGTAVVTAPGFVITLVSANGTAVPVTVPATTYAGIAVQPGSNGAIVFTVQTIGGYTGTIATACDLNGTALPAAGLPVVPALPAGIGCLYSPASFVITGNSTATEMLNITTQKLNTTSANRVMNPILAVLLLPGAGLALFGLRRRKALRTWQQLALLCLIFAGSAVAVGGLSGCGNGLNLTGAPKGSYLVPITFSDGTTTQVFPITLSISSNE